MMDIKKGCCRLILNSGLVTFGEVLEIKKEHIVFVAFNPAAIGRSIPIKNIAEIESCDEDDIPAYE